MICWFFLFVSIARKIDWAVFNVSTNAVQVIWETVLQVKRPNQQYQSTEGKDVKKVKKTQKSKQHKLQQQ